MAVCICILCTALNLILGGAAAALGLPLYLDTVGTVLAAVLGGYLPGVLVGFATNILKSISDPSSLYYGVLNIMIAVAATYLAGRGCFTKRLKAVVPILLFTFIGGA